MLDHSASLQWCLLSVYGDICLLVHETVRWFCCALAAVTVCLWDAIVCMVTLSIGSPAMAYFGTMWLLDQHMYDCKYAPVCLKLLLIEELVSQAFSTGMPDVNGANAGRARLG